MAKVKGITLVGGVKTKATVPFLKETKSAFDPASITSPNFNDTTLTVTGAQLGDIVLVTPKTSVPAGGLIWGFVSAVDTVTIRFYGINAAAAVDFASQDFDVHVLRVV